MRVQHNQTLHDQALRVLREAIVVGRFQQGEHLGEPGIAELLGVSRSTARATLKELATQGLLESRANGRLYVRTLDPNTIADIFSVRASLESLAGATIAAACGKVDIKPLEDALDELRSAESEEVEEFLNKDIAFHRTLCQLSGNETLVRAWESIEGLIRMAILSAGVDLGRLNMAAEKHEPFLEALKMPQNVAEQVIKERILATVAVLQSSISVRGNEDD